MFRATEQNDLPELVKFLRRIYRFDASDFHVDPRMLEWKYLDPRPGWQGGRSYLLESKGQIVAHCGVCPLVLRLPDGKTLDSMILLDWAADPSAPGVGTGLYLKLMRMAPTCLAIGGAPDTRAMLPRIGFRGVGEALTYSVWLRPWQEFRCRPFTVRSPLRLVHGLARPVRKRAPESAGWDGLAVNRFDDSLAPVLNCVRRSWAFCQRTLADLNYLLQCPHGKMQGFLLRRRGEIAGYFVLGTVDWEARLLDLMVDTEDAEDWNFAVAVVTEAAHRDTKVSRMRALSSLPVLTRALAWNGYWCQYKEPIGLYDPSAAMGQVSPVSLQLFDGDGGY